MVVALAFVGRAFGAAAIVVLAISKSVAGVDRMWLPVARSQRSRNWLLSTAVVIELTLAFVVLFSPIEAWAEVAALACFFTVVTLYGLASIKRIGNCGCSPESHKTSPRLLFVRNVALFAALSLGVVVGPSASELVTVGAKYAPALAIAPGLLLAVLLVVRLSHRAIYARSIGTDWIGARLARQIGS